MTGIDLLVKNGIDSALFVTDHLGMTPLILACAYAHAPAAKGLVDLGADVRAVDKEGKGALWHLYHPSLSMATTLTSANMPQTQQTPPSRPGQGLGRIPHIPGSERVRGNPNRLRSATSKSPPSRAAMGGPDHASADQGKEAGNTVAAPAALSSSSRASSAAADRANAPKKGRLIIPLS